LECRQRFIDDRNGVVDITPARLSLSEHNLDDPVGDGAGAVRSIPHNLVTNEPELPGNVDLLPT
jgi:hypothetical protein